MTLEGLQFPANTFAHLETKLSPPQNYQEALVRPRLTLSKNKIEQKKLITICAPAGFGKSILMAQWFEQLQNNHIACSWLSLEEGDNDLARFFEYLVAALQSLNPEIGKKVQSTLQAGSITSYQPILEILLTELCETKKKMVLFVDDFHLIQEPIILQAFQTLIQNTAANFHLILATRKKPNLNLYKLMLADLHFHVEAKDLFFNPKEMEIFFSKNQSIELNHADLQMLNLKTEGWIAALQLISILLKNEEEPSLFLERLTGSDRDITDYLSEEVLKHQPEQIKEFILKSSILNRMCAELCQEVTNEAESQKILEYLENSQIFLIPLDRQRKWYRFHHLFREFLISRFRRHDTKECQSIYQKASLWHARQGLQHEAIHYSLMGKDFERASEMVANYALELVQHRGDHSTLFNWIKLLPEQALARYPIIRIGYAFSLAFTLKFAECEAEIKLIEKYIHQKDISHRQPKKQAEFDAIRSLIEIIQCLMAAFRENTQECQQRSEKWLNDWPEADDYQKGVIHATLGASHLYSGRFHDAFQFANQADHFFQTCFSFYGSFWSRAIMGIIRVHQGRFKEAEHIYENLLSFIDKKLGGLFSAKAMVSLLLGELKLEGGDIKNAKAYLKDCYHFIRTYSCTTPTISGYTTLAKIQLLEGNFEQAERLLLEGEDHGRETGFNRLSFVLAAERIRLYLSHGQIEKGIQLAQAMDLFTESPIEPNHPMHGLYQEVFSILQARCLLAQQKNKAALVKLTETLQMVERQEKLPSTIRILSLMAVAYYQLGDKNKAQQKLSRALKLSIPEGITMVFAEETKGLQDLWAQILFEPKINNDLLMDEDFRSDLQKLLEIKPKEIKANPEPVEELSKREKEIIHQLNSDRSNQDIAKSLFISKGTLKWHIHNIYSKLGVHSRSGAVAKAKAYCLI